MVTSSKSEKKDAEKTTKKEQVNIDDVLNQSRDRIKDQQKESSATPGPGRPAGRKNNETLEREEQEALAQVKTPNPQTALLLKQIIAIPFDRATLQTGFAGFRLEEKEGIAIAEAADVVIQTYLPQVSGKHAVLVTLAVTLGATVLAKYTAYQLWLKEKETTTEKTEVKTLNV